MRGFLAGLLVAVGLLLLPLADVAVWTQRSLLSTSGFTDLATDVLHEPAVRQALAERVADELQQRDSDLRAGRRVVVAAVREVAASQSFESVFRATTGSMHSQLERGDDQLSLNLDAALPEIRDRVARVDPTLAELVPEEGDLPSITVLERDEVPVLWEAVQIVRPAALAFPLVVIALFALAVVAARRRGVMLAVIGIGTIVVAVLIAAALRFGQDPLSDVVGSQVNIDAFDAGYDVVVGSLIRQTVVMGGLGALLGAAGLASVIWYGRNLRPTGWA
jgi:hypothetical protein